MRKMVSTIVFIIIISSLYVCYNFLNEGFTPAAEEEEILYQREIGDEVILDTYNLTVIGVDEKQYISSYYGSSAEAENGAKFVLIALKLENTADKDFMFSSNLRLVDNKGNEYHSYPYTKDNLDNHLDNRKLSPNMKEVGYIVYEIPTESTSYSLFLYNSETREIFEIQLK